MFSVPLIIFVEVVTVIMFYKGKTNHTNSFLIFRIFSGFIIITQ